MYSLLRDHLAMHTPVYLHVASYVSPGGYFVYVCFDNISVMNHIQSVTCVTYISYFPCSPVPRRLSLLASSTHRACTCQASAQLETASFWAYTFSVGSACIHLVHFLPHSWQSYDRVWQYLGYPGFPSHQLIPLASMLQPHMRPPLSKFTPGTHAW